MHSDVGELSASLQTECRCFVRNHERGTSRWEDSKFLQKVHLEQPWLFCKYTRMYQTKRRIANDAKPEAAEVQRSRRNFAGSAWARTRIVRARKRFQNEFNRRDRMINSVLFIVEPTALGHGVGLAWRWAGGWQAVARPSRASCCTSKIPASSLIYTHIYGILFKLSHCAIVRTRCNFAAL